ncbi:MAG: HAD-IA family hydrolase, partial [Steroidobacteraceae bacterium]
LVASELEPVPSVLPVLTALADRGARMAVASNSHSAYIEHALRTCGIRHFFGDRIASADQVERLKPAPDIYLLAARMLGTPAQQCIAVEDSEVGIVAANAAGMRAIAFCPPGHVFTAARLKQAGAQNVIADFGQLLDLLD